MPNTLYDALTGAVIGLARSTEGNEDLMAGSTHRALLAALVLEPNASEDALSEMIAVIREEKRKLVPNCFDCAMPCGRTSDFDLRELALEEESVRLAKHALLATLRSLAKSMESDSPKIPYFYEALCFIGYDCATAEQIKKISEKLSQ